MTTLTTALNTTFTPAAGTFNVQCTKGSVKLMRRQTSGADWGISGVLANGQVGVVDNSVAATDYKFVAVDGSPTVQADQ